MRFVIYDDETVEPITVVSVPGLGDRDIERMGRWLVLAPMPTIVSMIDRGEEPRRPGNDIVCVRFEKFRRRDVWVWMAFTKQADIAMLLEPDFLPGQRGEVNRLRDRAASLDRLFMKAFGLE